MPLIMSLAVFMFILSLLILVHEWGHFMTARKCGVRIEQFALGFGPKLFGWTKDGCEFCLCAVPLGGFVKMAGDERDKCSGSSDEYFNKSLGQRALIVLMGPVVNLILAYGCFWLMFMVGYVDMDLSNQKLPAVVGQVVAHSPAEQAGLKTGDKVLSINGHLIARWSQLLDLVSNSTENRLNLSIEREKHVLAVAVFPKETDQQDFFGRMHKTRRIGVGVMSVNSADDIVITRYGFFESFVKAGEELWSITVKTYGSLYEMAIGARSPKDAMGIVGMFFVIKFALTIGFSYVLISSGSSALLWLFLTSCQSYLWTAGIYFLSVLKNCGAGLCRLKQTCILPKPGLL